MPNHCSHDSSARPARAISAAGVSFGGVGAAFRGLAAGLAAHRLDRMLKAWRDRRLAA